MEGIMKRYMSKVEYVYATQFDGTATNCKEIVELYKKAVHVAYKNSISFDLGNGVFLSLSKGDWICQDNKGREFVLTDNEFSKHFIKE